VRPVTQSGPSVSGSRGFALCLFIAIGLHAVVLMGWRADPISPPSLPPALTLRFSMRPQAAPAPLAPSTPAVSQSAERATEVHPEPSVLASPTEPRQAVEAPAPVQPKTEAATASPAAPQILASAQQPDGSAAQAAVLAARARYEQVLAAWLDRHKYYPASLRRRGLEGEGVLRVALSRDGRVLDLESFEAMPDALLDRVAMDWVRRADPFPAVPEEIPGDEYSIRFPVRFSLD
jgi:protein TonB